MYRRLLALASVALAGCVWDSTLDSTYWHLQAKLTSHFEAVPAMGTSRNYHLEVRGFEPVSVSCSSHNGKLSAASDGERLAYQCGNGWQVVYVENHHLFERCGPGLDALDWAKIPTFPAAAAELAKCTTTLADLLSALRARGMSQPEIVATLILTFEKGAAPAGYASSVAELPDELREAIRERLAPQLRANPLPSLTAVAELVEMVGLDDRTEATVLSHLETAAEDDPQAVSSLVSAVTKRRGAVSAARFACRLLRKRDADGIVLGVLAQSTEPCPAFEAQLRQAMADPEISCADAVRCDGGSCVAELPAGWDAYERFPDDEARTLLLHAAQARGELPSDLAIAIARKGYLVEMPQTPRCEDAAHNVPCQCELVLCKVARGAASHRVGPCRIRFDDAHRRARVVGG